MTSYKTILYEKQRGGVLITLNRPEVLNAISRELAGEFATALTEAETDPEIRAIVVTGAGRAFSSGYDIGAGGHHVGDFAGLFGGEHQLHPTRLARPQSAHFKFQGRSRFVADASRNGLQQHHAGGVAGAGIGNFHLYQVLLSSVHLGLAR